MTVWSSRPEGYSWVMKKVEENPLYYTGAGMMSYNAMLNLLYGGRGTGKTFWFKAWALFAAKGETIWMRRYDNEIHDAQDRFIDDLASAGLITEDMDIRSSGNVISLDGEERIKFVPLSLSTKKKSVPYPNVNQICFDEFIETRVNRSYLPNEAEMLLEFISTVNRYRPDRPEVKTFLIGNKVSWFNPYTAYFRIEPFESQYRTYRDGLICVENYENRAFEEAMKRTRFGQLIAGTKYEAYAIENNTLRDNSDFIVRRPKDSWPRLNIRSGEQVFGLWTDGNKLYFSEDHDPSRRTYADRQDLRDRELALKTNEPPVTWLLQFHQMGMLCFDSGLCKTKALEIMLTYWK